MDVSQVMTYASQGSPYADKERIDHKTIIGNEAPANGKLSVPAPFASVVKAGLKADKIAVVPPPALGVVWHRSFDELKTYKSDKALTVETPKADSEHVLNVVAVEIAETPNGHVTHMNGLDEGANERALLLASRLPEASDVSESGPRKRTMSWAEL